MSEYKDMIPDIREYLCSDCTGGCSSCIYTKWFNGIEDLINEFEGARKDLGKCLEALDNACDMLETYDLANNELTRPKHSKEEWKEWAFKR